MGFTWITPVDVSPGANGWTTIDCSGIVPAGATGVCLRYILNGSTQEGFRKYGSTDSFLGYPTAGYPIDVHVGLDGSRLAEQYCSNKAKITSIFVVGYWDSDATFFTNCVYRSITGANYTYIDADFSSDCPSATGIITHQSGTAVYLRSYGIRCKGSTDTFGQTGRPANTLSVLLKCDSGQTVQVYRTSSDGNQYVIGYITGGVTWYTDGQDYSPSGTGAWENVSNLPSGATGGFFILSEGGNYGDNKGLRPEGSSETYYPHYYCSDVTMDCDGSQQIEAYAANARDDVYLFGYVVGGVSATYNAIEQALTITAQSPTLQADSTYAAIEQTLAIAALDPSMQVNALYAAVEQALTIAALDPAVDIDATYAAVEQALAIAALDPGADIDATYAAAEQTLAIAALDPSAEANSTYAAVEQALAVAAVDPEAQASSTYAAVEQALAIAAWSPTVTTGGVVDDQYDAVELSLTIAAQPPTPTADSTYSAVEQALAIAALDPAVDLDATYDAVEQALAIAAWEPPVEADSTYAAPEQTLAIAALDPSTEANSTFDATEQALIINALDPAVDLDATYAAAEQMLAIAAWAPTVTTELYVPPTWTIALALPADLTAAAPLPPDLTTSAPIAGDSTFTAELSPEA